MIQLPGPCLEDEQTEAEEGQLFVLGHTATGLEVGAGVRVECVEKRGRHFAQCL